MQFGVLKEQQKKRFWASHNEQDKLYIVRPLVASGIRTIQNETTLCGIDAPGDAERNLALRLSKAKIELLDAGVAVGLSRKLMEHDCTYYYAEREYDGMQHQLENLIRHTEFISNMISLCNTYSLTAEVKHTICIDIRNYRMRASRVANMAQSLMVSCSHFSRTVNDIISEHGSVNDYLKTMRRAVYKETGSRLSVEDTIEKAYSDICRMRYEKYGDGLDDNICSQLELKAETEQKVAYEMELKKQRKREEENKEKEKQDRLAKAREAINNAILQKAEQEQYMADYKRRIEQLSKMTGLEQEVVDDLMDEYISCVKRYTAFDKAVLNINRYADDKSLEQRIDKKLLGFVNKVNQFMVDEAPDLALLLEYKIKHGGIGSNNRSAKLASFVNSQLHEMNEHGVEEVYLLIGLDATHTTTIGRGDITFSYHRYGENNISMQVLDRIDILKLLHNCYAFTDLDSAEKFTDEYKVEDAEGNCRRKAIIYKINKQVLLNLRRLAGSSQCYVE